MSLAFSAVQATSPPATDTVRVPLLSDVPVLAVVSGAASATSYVITLDPRAYAFEVSPGVCRVLRMSGGRRPKGASNGCNQTTHHDSTHPSLAAAKSARATPGLGAGHPSRLSKLAASAVSW